MKSLFRGSAVIAATILSASFLLSARSSVAETPVSSLQTPNQELSQGNKQDPKKGLAGLEMSSVVTASAEEAKVTIENAPKTTAAGDSADAKSVNRTPVSPVGSNSIGAMASGSELGALRTGAAYTATAYSLYGRTASGLRVSKGLIAADPRVLPLGTRVRLEAGAYSGEYLVADTGGAVRGKRIDIWTPNTREAFRFGRRLVKLTVLSYPAKRASALRHRKA